MTTNFDELYKCAALADWIYARQGVDQAIQRTDIKQDLIVLNAGTALVETPTLRREDNGLYYSDQGFVGAIVQDGSETIVVLRGTDMGTAGPLDILSAFADGSGRTQIDGEDWHQNAMVGNGSLPGPLKLKMPLL